MGYVLIKNNKSSINVEDYVESIDLLNKIKLYSTFNNEELGAFSLKPEEVKNAYQRSVKEKSYTEFKKLWNSGYKFNDHPTIPNEDWFCWVVTLNSSQLSRIIFASKTTRHSFWLFLIQQTYKFHICNMEQLVDIRYPSVPIEERLWAVYIY